MQFNDSFGFKDGITHLKGHVKIYHIKDEFENLIIEKDNLITLRGRSYALEQLFKEPINGSGLVNTNRVPCLFKIGSGGADIGQNGANGLPFNPYIPSFDDTDLGNPVPFLSIDPAKNSNELSENNPSIVTELAESDLNTYFLPKETRSGVSSYYGKIFEAGSSYVYDQSRNTVFRKIELKVTQQEARGNLINELGLVIAELDTTNHIAKDAELSTRVTFPSIALTDLNSHIRVEYYLYA